MSPPLRPCIPTRALTPPTGERWVHEVKFDGYRLLARRVGERVVLRTRGGFDWAGRYPRIVRSVLNLSVSSVTMDGEVAILTEDGVSDFDALHSRTNDGWAILLAFDLLEIEGEDLRDQPLLERKRRLRRLLSRRDDGLQYVEFLEGDGATIFAHAPSASPAATPMTASRSRRAPRAGITNRSSERSTARRAMGRST